MSIISGKIIDLNRSKVNDNSLSIGIELCRLRKLAGYSEAEVASSMGASVDDIALIETTNDLPISKIKSYINALGASLRLDASFPMDSQAAFYVRDAFDLPETDESQLIMPIFEDEPFPVRRDVVLSIKPQYTEKIFQGQKTIELRRRFPSSVPKGTRAYIYSTTPDKSMLGTAEIREVYKLPIAEIWRKYSDFSCVTKDDFDKYFEGVIEGYALDFSNVRAFARPLHLSELKLKYGFRPPQSYLYVKHELREALRHEQAIVSA